jgi:prolycopene isomerase
VSEPEVGRDAYDVVVVGTGLAGMSAAACLASAGKKVLAVEQGDGAGGYAHAFRRGDYLFDPAVHVTASGFGDLAFWDIYLGALGVRDQVELASPTPFYTVMLPELQFDAPIGIDEFTEAHVRLFPHEAEGIRRFVQVCVQITDETQQVATRLSLSGLDQALEQFPLMFRYRTTTLAEALDEYIDDVRAKAVLGGAWPYQGLPPSQLSLVQYGGMIAALAEKGPVYFKGSFQSLVDAFAASLAEHGGELLLNTRVTKIGIEDGQVTGVVLDDDRVVHAPAVVSNADAKQTLEQLVGLEHLPDSLVKRYRRMKPSISAFVLYAATTLDITELGLAHETFVYPTWDHEQTYRDALDGKLGGTWLSLPTLHDSSLAPEGEHLVIFTTLMPYDIGTPWEEAGERYTELMLEALEAVMPGIRDRITFLEIASPVTLERYTLNQQGAMYGWANAPNQTMPKRLPHQLPVSGLFLAGHWTEPGSSCFRVVFSGVQAAQSILGYATPVELFQALYSHSQAGP